MKQCLDCGRRYADSNPACPKCYSPRWGEPNNEGASKAVLKTSVVCDKCGVLVEGGTARCPHCRRMLAPGMLKVLCILGIVGAPAVIIFQLKTLTEHWAMRPWQVLPDILLALVALPILLGLLHASGMAWNATRGLLIASLCAAAVMAVVARIMGNYELMANMAGMLLLRFVGIIPLWLFLNSRDVKEFAGIETAE